jgi:hypothetical protein
MRLIIVTSVAWWLPLLACSCAEPAQLGGLGVFRPQGFEGRMALANRVHGSATLDAPRQRPRVASTTDATVKRP